jgi:N-methylhydantoinase B/oxoprolinase/acetone carboxylase alpha subunit
MIGTPLDAFTLEILRSYLVSTVREMVATTTRTAYSTCFAHGEDFTCGLFDAQGRLIAQDQGIPVHAGALGDAVAHVIATAGRFEPGDVLVHNDPYNGGTHQADGLICRPMFFEDALVGFAVNRGHWTDVGGMAPGGWSGSAEDVNQEALIIPSVRLLAGGEVVEDVKRLILRNVRLPVQLWGDIQAQIASNVVAERRIVELIRKQGRERFASLVEATLDYSRRRFLLGLEQIENGVAEAADVIEDDGRGRGPLTIRVRLEKRPDGISVEFAGTDPQAAAPMNSTLACTKAAVICSVIAVVDAEIPLNAGLVELIDVTAPAGSLVNPVPPAPAFGATADPSDRVSEAVLRALAELAPSRVPAGSYSTGNNVTGGGLRPDGSQFLWYSYQAGGCGARPWADGNSAEWHLMANSRNESMEVWETRYPVEFLSFRLLADSGGPGRFRGGLGTERRLRLTQPTRLSGLSDHHTIGPVGVQGGRAGLPNGFAIERDGRRRTIAEEFGLPSPSKFANLPLEPGDVFVSIQGGGGGFGDPRERQRERVRTDVEAGYVSPEQARDAYGYEASK